MLKLTLKPGEYIDIGADVRVVFSGGSANNIHLLIDAPKNLNILRSSAGKGRKKDTGYYGEQKISEEAQREIAGIIMREKHRALNSQKAPVGEQNTPAERSKSAQKNSNTAKKSNERHVYTVRADANVYLQNPRCTAGGARASH